MHKLKARTYSNADRTKVVPEASIESAWFIGGEGAEIEESLAKQLGLLDTKKEPKPETKNASAELEDKAAPADEAKPKAKRTRKAKAK